MGTGSGNLKGTTPPLLNAGRRGQKSEPRNQSNKQQGEQFAGKATGLLSHSSSFKLLRNQCARNQQKKLIWHMCIFAASLRKLSSSSR